MCIRDSIQAEGVFAELKQNMGYWRIRRRGLANVATEVMLTLLGSSLRRFRSFLSTGKPPASWKAPEGMEPQRFKKPSPKKLSKKGARIRAKMDAYRKAKSK